MTIVVSSLAGTPLGYSTVALAEIHVERFSNSFGELYFLGLDEGEYHIRVKQLGFSAQDLAVRVGPDAPNPRFIVRLRPIAFLLDKIVVTAPSNCPEPTDLSDPKNYNLSLILGEVRKNAERHNLLLNRYPFRYRFAREFAKIIADGGQQATADNNGNFILGGLPPGDTESTVSSPGFATIKISVEVAAGKLLTVALMLYPES